MTRRILAVAVLGVVLAAVGLAMVRFAARSTP